VDRHEGADRPELSDLVVDFDPRSLERRDVALDAVLARLPRPVSARRTARAFAGAGGVLDRGRVDGALIRAHLELQRLHEEFRVGALLRDLLAPMVGVIRERTGARPIRVVDLGCGLGYITRWLAARGGLGPGVELIGADCNEVLIAAAATLARDEQLPCRFVAGNAFALREPADVIVSTGVLHHFRGDALAAVFAEHQRSAATGFVHVDIRPTILAPIGSWIFHQARMREPLARFDGVRSAVRAHGSDTILSAAASGAPGFARATLDARPGALALLRIFQAVIGIRGADGGVLRGAYASFGRRFRVA
jgi:SAM-dependent methyltransferase